MPSVENAKIILQSLQRAGIDVVASLPDAFLVHVIEGLEASNEFLHLPVTREEEGIGICTGAYLGGKRCASRPNAGRSHWKGAGPVKHRSPYKGAHDRGWSGLEHARTRQMRRLAGIEAVEPPMDQRRPLTDTFEHVGRGVKPLPVDEDQRFLQTSSRIEQCPFRRLEQLVGLLGATVGVVRVHRFDSWCVVRRVRSPLTI